MYRSPSVAESAIPLRGSDGNYIVDSSGSQLSESKVLAELVSQGALGRVCSELLTTSDGGQHSLTCGYITPRGTSASSSLCVSPLQFSQEHLPLDLGSRAHPCYPGWPHPKILYLNFMGIILFPNKVAFPESGIRDSVSFDASLSPPQCPSSV